MAKKQKQIISEAQNNRIAEQQKDNNSKPKKESMLTKFFGKVPRSSQDTLPYEGVFTNGVIEVTPGKFSKSYPLADANFKIASPEEQANIFIKYQ